MFIILYIGGYGSICVSTSSTYLNLQGSGNPGSPPDCSAWQPSYAVPTAQDTCRAGPQGCYCGENCEFYGDCCWDYDLTCKTPRISQVTPPNVDSSAAGSIVTLTGMCRSYVYTIYTCSIQIQSVVSL